MSLKRKIAFNTVIQFIGRFITSFIGFLTTVILARYLGAQQYGVYAKIYTLAAFFYLFIDFGLNAVYVRRYKNDLSKIWSVFSIRTAFFLVSLLLITLLFALTGNALFNQQEKIWVILFSPTILLFGYYTTFNIVFQLKLRYDLSVIASVLGGSIGLLFLIAFLKYGLIYAIAAIVVGYAFTVIFAFLFSKKLECFSLTKKKINFSFLANFLKESFPLGTMLFLNTMYSRVDVFILSAIKGDTAVGIYQLAYKFFEFPLAFAAFFANSIFPHYVKIYEEDKSRFHRVFRKSTLYLVIASLFFTVGGLIIAPYLGLIKTDYIPSQVPLQILVLSFPIFFLTSALSWLLFVQKKEKTLVWVYGLSFIINAVANFAFIPYFGYLASSWITVFGEVLILLMLVVIIRMNNDKA